MEAKAHAQNYFPEKVSLPTFGCPKNLEYFLCLRGHDSGGIVIRSRWTSWGSSWAKYLKVGMAMRYSGTYLGTWFCDHAFV